MSDPTQHVAAKAPEVTVLALHGFTQNGAGFSSHLADLATRLEPHVRFVCPDGPLTCSERSVRYLKAAHRIPLSSPPYRCWWDATDDGRVYRGWENTRESMREHLERYPGAGLLGFSQGAVLAATLAALSARGDMPPIAFVVMVAGGIPRSDTLKPLFNRAISVPSLHVWGERDQLALTRSAALAERFDSEMRATFVWPGSHVLPTRGPGGDALATYLGDRARRLPAPNDSVRR